MEVFKKYYASDIYDLKELCWCGALDRIDEAIENGIEDEFFDYISENFNGWGDIVELTEVNDFIWFECDEWLEENKPEEEEKEQ